MIWQKTIVIVLVTLIAIALIVWIYPDLFKEKQVTMPSIEQKTNEMIYKIGENKSQESGYIKPMVEELKEDNTLKVIP